MTIYTDLLTVLTKRFYAQILQQSAYLFKDTIASVAHATEAITLDNIGGTLNQYASHIAVIMDGVHKFTCYTIASNTNATPTVLTVNEDITEVVATALAGASITVYNFATLQDLKDDQYVREISQMNLTYGESVMLAGELLIRIKALEP